MRVVAIGAITLRAGMLNFCGLDVLSLLVVASDAKRLRIFFGQDDFAIFSRLVTRGAGILIGERSVYERVLEFRTLRFMRIVASHAIGLFEWLIVMSLFQIRTRCVMAIKTKGWSRFGEVVIEFALADFASLMGDVASAAPHIECCVAASALRDVDTDLVATQAQIFIFIVAFSWLK